MCRFFLELPMDKALAKEKNEESFATCMKKRGYIFGRFDFCVYFRSVKGIIKEISNPRFPL